MRAGTASERPFSNACLNTTLRILPLPHRSQSARRLVQIFLLPSFPRRHHDCHGSKADECCCCCLGCCSLRCCRHGGNAAQVLRRTRRKALVLISGESWLCVFKIPIFTKQCYALNLQGTVSIVSVNHLFLTLSYLFLE